MDRSRILRSWVVDFLRSTPLLSHIIQREISLRYLIEARTNVAMGRVFLGVDAIYGAGSDAGGAFCSDARFGDDVAMGRHLRLFHRMPRESKFNVTLLAYGADD